MVYYHPSLETLLTATRICFCWQFFTDLGSQWDSSPFCTEPFRRISLAHRQGDRVSPTLHIAKWLGNQPNQTLCTCAASFNGSRRRQIPPRTPSRVFQMPSFWNSSQPTSVQPLGLPETNSEVETPWNFLMLGSDEGSDGSGGPIWGGDVGSFQGVVGCSPLDFCTFWGSKKSIAHRDWWFFAQGKTGTDTLKYTLWKTGWNRKNWCLEVVFSFLLSRLSDTGPLEGSGASNEEVNLMVNSTHSG